MKTTHRLARLALISIALLIAALPLSAQLPGTVTRTNMQIAPTITNGATYTYSGTNLIELTRYGEVGWEIAFRGTNFVSTSNVTQTFRFSMDGTNWLTTPIYSWVFAADGTNAVRHATNWDIGTFNFMQPYQITSPNTNDITNAVLYGYAKGYRRD